MQDTLDIQSPPPIKNKKDKQHKKSYKEIKHESKYDDIQAKQLDRVVVTAGGYEQDIKTAPASISIIPKEEILTRPIRDIGEAVQDVPGVYVESDKTGFNKISMRGLGTAYTLILIDGKRQNVAQGFSSNGFGEALNANMPPPSMIERIEVIRGPASTLYGSDAMGGVINIITKKHSDKVSAGIQLDSRISNHREVFGDQYGVNGYVTTPIIKDTLSINVRGGFRDGGQNAFYKPGFNSGYTGNNQQSFNGTGTGPNINPYAAHSSTAYTNWNAGFRLNYTPNTHNFIYLDSEVMFVRAGSLNTASENYTSVRDFYKINNVLSYDTNYDWGKISSYMQYSATLWAQHYDDYRKSQGWNGLLPGSYKGSGVDWSDPTRNQDIVLQSAYNNDFDLGKAGAIIFNGGVYYLFEHIHGGSNNSSYTGPAKSLGMHQAALFAEGEYLINDYVSTTLGLRLNYSDKFNSFVVPNPRFYVNLNPTQWLTLKGGIASGVLAPTLSYVYDGKMSSTRGNSTIYGNTNLKPEQSWNYELSAILDLEPTMLILTGFYTDYSNKIVTDSTIASGQVVDGVQCSPLTGDTTCTFYRNADKAEIYGAELTFKLKPVWFVGLDASYGYTHSKTISGSGAGEPINAVPEHRFTLKPSLRIWNFDFYVRYSGNFRTPIITQSTRTTLGRSFYKDYQLVDLALTYKFLKNYSATFAVNNLLDVKTYTEFVSNTNIYQRILPARNFWLSIKADF